MPSRTTAAVDTTLRVDDGSYGWLRLAIPTVTFRRIITLYAVGEDGFVALQDRPNLWHEFYFGLQLQMGSSESYVEWLFGRSDNLRPERTTRWRVTVQLQIPQTPLTFRLIDNRALGPNRRDPELADSPIGAAVVTKIPIANFFRALGLVP